MVVKQLKNLLSFLTIFPVSVDKDFFSDCANYMFAFPLVGALIGLIAGVFGWALHLVIPSILVGVLVLAMILLITGVHHTDGLLDFGDGVMVHGSAEHKLEVMHDKFTGAGGLTLGIIVILVTAVAIGQLNQNLLIQSIIVIEVAAKLSMVVGTWAGNPVRQGMNSPFMKAMHGRNGHLRLIAALAISFAFALPLLRLAGFFTLTAAILTSLVMVAVAHKHFNGVTGDVLGATNEISRMVSIIVLLTVIGWA